MPSWLWVAITVLPWAAAIIYYVFFARHEGRDTIGVGRDAVVLRQRANSARQDLEAAQAQSRRGAAAVKAATPVASPAALAALEHAVETCALAAHAADTAARVLGHDGDAGSRDADTQARQALAAMRRRLGLHPDEDAGTG